MNDLSVNFEGVFEMADEKILLKHYSTKKKYGSLFDELVDEDSTYIDLKIDLYTEQEIEGIEVWQKYMAHQTQNMMMNQQELQRKKGKNMNLDESYSQLSENVISESEEKNNRKRTLKKRIEKEKHKRRRKEHQTKHLLQDSKDEDKRESTTKVKVALEDFWKLHIISKSFP